MLGFYAIRSYSSVGVADLVFTPPWNPRGNYRPLLVQCKNTKSKDYVDPFERDKLGYLQQYNSGNVVLVYKDKKQVMVKVWDTQKKYTIEEFLREEYGIPVKSYSDILSSFNKYKRPIHMFYVPKEIYTNRNGKPAEKDVAPFPDFYMVDVYFPHVAEHYRDKHL